MSSRWMIQCHSYSCKILHDIFGFSQFGFNNSCEIKFSFIHNYIKIYSKQDQVLTKSHYWVIWGPFLWQEQSYSGTCSVKSNIQQQTTVDINRRIIALNHIDLISWYWICVSLGNIISLNTKLEISCDVAEVTWAFFPALCDCQCHFPLLTNARHRSC